MRVIDWMSKFVLILCTVNQPTGNHVGPVVWPLKYVESKWPPAQRREEK